MNKFFVITCILFTSCMSEKEMKELRKELEKPYSRCREYGGLPKKHIHCSMDVPECYAGCDFPCKGN
jgi:hypothetical protein